MNIKNIVEYALLAIIILAPTFALTNEANQFRLNKIEMYLNFPTQYQDYTPTDRMILEQVRDLILKNAGAEYYEPTGMNCQGKIWIEREENLFALLEQLACLPEGTYGVYYEPYVRDCDPMVQKDAEKLINETIKNDLSLFDFTAKNYNCQASRTGTFIEYGKRVIECICGSQDWRLPIY